jgi:hypothetical protein
MLRKIVVVAAEHGREHEQNTAQDSDEKHG